jgi:dihydroneopterin aldolase
VHRHEKRKRQPIRINVDLTVCEEKSLTADRLADVVDYESVVDGIRALVSSGHVNLVETLAERIAAQCLEDPRVLAVRVRVEKLAAVQDAASVGVEIERVRSS